MPQDPSPRGKTFTITRPDGRSVKFHDYEYDDLPTDREVDDLLAQHDADELKHSMPLSPGKTHREIIGGGGSATPPGAMPLSPGKTHREIIGGDSNLKPPGPMPSGVIGGAGHSTKVTEAPASIGDLLKQGYSFEVKPNAKPSQKIALENILRGKPVVDSPKLQVIKSDPRNSAPKIMSVRSAEIARMSSPEEMLRGNPNYVGSGDEAMVTDPANAKAPSPFPWGKPGPVASSQRLIPGESAQVSPGQAAWEAKDARTPIDSILATARLLGAAPSAVLHDLPQFALSAAEGFSHPSDVALKEMATIKESHGVQFATYMIPGYGHVAMGADLMAILSQSALSGSVEPIKGMFSVDALEGLNFFAGNIPSGERFIRLLNAAGAVTHGVSEAMRGASRAAVAMAIRGAYEGVTPRTAWSLAGDAMRLRDAEVASIKKTAAPNSQTGILQGFGKRRSEAMNPEAQFALDLIPNPLTERSAFLSTYFRDNGPFVPTLRESGLAEVASQPVDRDIHFVDDQGNVVAGRATNVRRGIDGNWVADVTHDTHVTPGDTSSPKVSVTRPVDLRTEVPIRQFKYEPQLPDLPKVDAQQEVPAADVQIPGAKKKQKPKQKVEAPDEAGTVRVEIKGLAPRNFFVSAASADGAPVSGASIRGKWSSRVTEGQIKAFLRAADADAGATPHVSDAVRQIEAQHPDLVNRLREEIAASPAPDRAGSAPEAHAPEATTVDTHPPDITAESPDDVVPVDQRAYEHLDGEPSKLVTLRAELSPGLDGEIKPHMSSYKKNERYARVYNEMAMANAAREQAFEAYSNNKTPENKKALKQANANLKKKVDALRALHDELIAEIDKTLASGVAKPISARGAFTESIPQNIRVGRAVGGKVITSVEQIGDGSFVVTTGTGRDRVYHSFDSEGRYIPPDDHGAKYDSAMADVLSDPNSMPDAVSVAQAKVLLREQGVSDAEIEWSGVFDEISGMTSREAILEALNKSRGIKDEETGAAEIIVGRDRTKAKYTVESEGGKDTIVFEDAGYTPAQQKRLIQWASADGYDAIRIGDKTTVITDDMMGSAQEAASLMTSGVPPQPPPGMQESEWFKARIEDLTKLAQGIWVPSDFKYKSRSNAGAYVHADVRLRFGSIRINSELPGELEVASTLAHELGHAIDMHIERKFHGKRVPQGNIEHLFGVDRKTSTIIKTELMRVTDSLVGKKAASRDPGYYYNGKELYARFVQSFIEQPHKLKSLAPTAVDAFIEMSEKAPVIGEFIAVTEGKLLDLPVRKIFGREIRLDAMKPLADRRQSYHRDLGRYLGEKAWQNELFYRSQRAKYLDYVRSLIHDRMVKVKDDPALLTAAAEGIKTIKADGTPEFGTKRYEYVDADDISGLSESELNAWLKQKEEDEGLTLDGIDALGRLQFSRWFKTPEQGQVAWNALSPEGKAVIAEYTAGAVDSNSVFNRNVAFDTFKLNNYLEGYVHHIHDIYASTGISSTPGMKQRVASSRRERESDVSSVEHFWYQTGANLRDLYMEKAWNEYVTRQLPTVARPAPGDLNGMPKGWILIEGSSKSGFEFVGKPILDQEGNPVKLAPMDGVDMRGKWMVPASFHDAFVKQMRPVEEHGLVMRALDDVGKYWMANQLLRPSSIVTNVIGGMQLFGAYVMHNAMLDATRFNGDSGRLVKIMKGATSVLRPASFKSGRADFLWGGDAGLFYHQWRNADGTLVVPNSDTGFNEMFGRLISPYASVERFFKRMIAESDLRIHGDGMTPVDMTEFNQEILGAINASLDLYTLDYINIPGWVEKLGRNPAGRMVKPFAVYPYKMMKTYMSLMGSAFDRNLPWQERAAKVMTLGVIVSSQFMVEEYLRRKFSTTQLPPEDASSEWTKERFKTGANARGLTFVGADGDTEYFMDTSKYPFLQVADMLRYAKDRDLKAGMQALGNYFGNLGPLGETAAGLFNLKDDFDTYKDFDVMAAERLKTFFPGHAILSDISNASDPYPRAPAKSGLRVFGQMIPAFNARAARDLHGPKRKVAVPIGSRGNYDIVVPYDQNLRIIRALTGVRVEPISRDWWDASSLREYRNSIYREAKPKPAR